MDDISSVEALINANGTDINEPLAADESQASAADIMKQMKFIGEKITEVSIREKENETWTKRARLFFLNYS